MARRRSKKAARKKTAGPKKRKPRLTREEMLARIPDQAYLTTPDVQHVFNDCHEVTVWKMTSKGELTAYRTRHRGKANCYKREDVVEAVENRFRPVPVRRPIRERDHDDDQREETP